MNRPPLLLLRLHAHQVNQERRQLRQRWFGFHPTNLWHWFILYRYWVEAVRVVLLYHGHPILEHSFITRLRAAIHYSITIDWSLHTFFLLFALVHLMLMTMEDKDTWFVLSNYMLLDVVEEYKIFVRSSQSGNRIKHLHRAQQRQWTQIQRQYRPVFQTLKLLAPPGYYSPEMFTSFALQLVPEHVPNAPFKCKCSMMAMYVLMEMFYFLLTVGIRIIIHSGSTGLLLVLLYLWSPSIPLWLSAFWVLEAYILMYECVRMFKLVGYLLFGGWLTVYTAHINLIVHNRLFFKLASRAREMVRVNPVRLMRGIARYQLELWRTIGLMIRANQSAMGKYLVTIVLVFDVPMNIMLINTAMFKIKSSYMKLGYCAFILLQIGCVLTFYAMFAEVCTLIHSTAKCFVPLQGAFPLGGNGACLKTKLALMRWYERVNNDKSISLSFASMAPITKQTICQFVLVYAAYFMTIMKMFMDEEFNFE